MTLRSTAGDFGAGTTACLVNDAAAITVLVLDNDPAPGDGTYYLVRPIGTGCRGTYDDGSTSQQGGRDAETASAPIACPKGDTPLLGERRRGARGPVARLRSGDEHVPTVFRGDPITIRRISDTPYWRHLDR